MSADSTRLLEGRVSYEEWLELTRSIDLQASDNHTKLASGSHCLAEHGSGLKVRFMPKPRDVIVQCPKCKTVETIEFVEDTLTPCQKFSQKDSKVYHDCGCELPCRLYSLS
jgi:hypothetical protein